MPIRPAALVIACLLAGCSTPPGAAPQQAGTAAACVQADDAVSRPGYCRYPDDVRSFLDDRDLCDHFRSEPWPESDSEEDRARREQLASGVKTACAGTDRRLAELRIRYRDDAAIQQLLSQFEGAIETGNRP